HAKRTHQFSLVGGKRSARLEQTHARLSLADGRKDAKQKVNSLARNRAANVEQVDAAAAGRAKRVGEPPVSIRIGLWRATGVHAVWYHHQPIQSDELIPPQILIGRDAVERHACGLLPAFQNSPR